MGGAAEAPSANRLAAWCAPVRGGRGRPSGGEPLDQPGPVFAAIAEAVVQAVVAVLPELVDRRRETHPSPERRPRDVVRIALANRLPARLEVCPAADRLALTGRPGAELARARPRREIHVGLGRLDLRDLALDADLSTDRVPVEDERTSWVLAEVARLPALVVRVEDEPAPVHSAEEDHPRRGETIGACGGEHDRVGHRHAAGACTLEPHVELAKRVGVEVGTPQHGLRGHPRSVRRRGDP